MAKHRKPLPAERQLELVSIAHQDGGASSVARAARDELVSTSLGLVGMIAESFLRTSAGFEFDDLFQEGCIALLDAIRWFNPRRGIQFQTYAADCIRRRLSKYLKNPKNAPQPQELESSDENPISQKLDDGGTENEQADVMMAAVRRLHPSDRLVVEGRLGLAGPVVSWGDLASQIGVSVRIVKAIYERAIRTLRSVASPLTSLPDGSSVA